VYTHGSVFFQPTNHHLQLVEEEDIGKEEEAEISPSPKPPPPRFSSTLSSRPRHHYQNHQNNVNRGQP
jgi:hypothetical protein